MEQPVLKLDRIILRPFSLSDAKDVQSMAGAEEIDRTTLGIPHPYLDGMAEEWINTHAADFEKGVGVTYAIVEKESLRLIGAIGLVNIDQNFQRAEMGYWVGVPYWAKGYCTEAAKAILRYGFEDLGLNRIYAYYFGNNPASGRVMQKIGMTKEGCFRQHIKKYGDFVDIVCYGILKDQWKKQDTKE